MKVKSQEIIDWFEIVCKGIRAEYEEGASHRDLEIDKNTLAGLLGEYYENQETNNDCG